MNLRARAHSLARALFGSGWIYRIPRYYDRRIDHFEEVRRRAFEWATSRLIGPNEPKYALDVACGTGLTATWIASRFAAIQVVGLDQSPAMLRAARRRAAQMNLSSRCRFLCNDAAAGDIRTLGIPPMDLVTCALGFSVLPKWQEAFWNTYALLGPSGSYIIFDQYEEGLVVPDYAADQSRKSWELLHSAFESVEVKWFGREFAAVGQRPISTVGKEIASADGNAARSNDLRVPAA